MSLPAHSFELKLPFIRNVLVVTSPTLPEVWTARFDAIRRRFDQLRHRASSEPLLLLLDFDVNLLPRQHKRDKHRHASPVRAGRGAGQPVTAVDQFFDGEKQVVSVARALLPAPDDARFQPELGHR